MSEVSAIASASARYDAAMALRHLATGCLGPRDAIREALAARMPEWRRLGLFVAFVACLGLVDPETRSLGAAALGNALDDGSRLQGLSLLALGAAIIGLALIIGYWSAALAALLLSGQGWSLASLARMRTVVALSGWISLLPTVVVKLLALALLPPAKIAADPPSLYSAIEPVMVVPYFAACLAGAFGLGMARAVLTAIAVNGAFYLLVVILSVVAPA